MRVQRINYKNIGKHMLQNSYKIGNIIINMYGSIRIVTKTTSDGIFMKQILRDGSTGPELFYQNSHLLNSEKVNKQKNLKNLQIINDKQNTKKLFNISKIKKFFNKHYQRI